MGPPKGTPKTEEHKAAIAAALKAKGIAPSAAAVKKAAKVNRGRKQSAAQRQRIREGLARAKAEGKQIGNPRRGSRYFAKQYGYWELVVWEGDERRRISEHRYVMEQKLGRPLRPGENVHHRNGDRTDNRPENLELWIRPQPTGCRVQDAVARAREIIDLYGDIGAS